MPFFLQNVVILLQRIYSGLSNPSSIPINPLPLQPPPFQPSSPPASLVVANSYWLLSLLLSISCALVALSLQRWAEPPTEINSSRGSLPEQARLRTLFAAGIERLNLTFLVEVLHCLMHIAFSIFLVGLLLYLFSVDFAIFLLAAAVTVLSFMAYAWLTVIPIIRPGSPYYTPFTNILAVTYAGVLYGTPRLLYLIKSLIHANMVTQGAVRYPEGRFRDWYLSSMKFKMAQELAPLLDSDVLKRTLDMLRSDDDLEQFFEAIPGFFASEIVQNPRGSLALLSQPLAEALVQFWNRTLTSDRVSESVKGRRLIICMRVIEAADLSIAVPRILQLFSGDLTGVSRSVEIAHSLGVLRNGNAASLARGIITSIIAINDKHDERWSTLAMDELDISEGVLQQYLANGNSLLLANVTHITSQFFDNLRRDSDHHLTQQSLSILPQITKFNILDTLPELQHDFCALWNKIVRQQAQMNVDNPFRRILNEIWSLYVALHGANAAFPSLCTVPSHQTTHTQEVCSTTTGGASHSTTTTSPVPTSEPSLGDALATSVVSGTAITSLALSTSQPIASPPSGTGDAPRPVGGIIVSSTVLILLHQI